MRAMLLAVLLAPAARAADVPFYLRSLDDPRAVGSLNENFRSIVGDLTKLRADVDAITAYQPIFGSTEPAHNASVASTSYVGVATMTMTGARGGGRTTDICIHFDIENDAGASRDYTYLAMFNGAALGSAFTFTNSGNSTGFVMEPFRVTTSTTGTNTVVLNILSSSAAGTQTAKNIKIHATEF